MKIHEFEGIPSGDSECFCFYVARDTFVKIMGHEPDEYDSHQVGSNELFSLYPDDLFKHTHNKFKITVSYEEVREEAQEER